MKAINRGDNTYDIFDDTMQVFEKLPAQSYVVRFSEIRGFFLEKYNDMEIKEPKVYGVHTEKVNKVMNMFERQDRNLGVILSGDKGIGKSLFAKMLSNAAIERGIPMIVVDRYIPGIASYIEDIEQEVMVLFDEFDKTFGEVKSKAGEASPIPMIVVDRYIPGIASYIEDIEQEVMVLFDEFDKTFGEVKSKAGEASPQTNLLSLFDGLSSGKKLFVVTCNELYKLNEYLINRPGRFHYHFRFEYPSANEIREYLTDKLQQEYQKEIDNVISFSNKISLNYDCLRAIATELNTGLTFCDAIKDLNIVNTEQQSYNLMLRFKNGVSFKAKDISMDMFGDDGDKNVYMYDNKGRNNVDITFNPCNAVYDTGKFAHVIPADAIKVEYYFGDSDVYMYDNKGRNNVDITFNPCNAVYDTGKFAHVIPADAIKVEYYFGDSEDEKAMETALKDAGVECLVINRKVSRNIHYNV